MHCSRPGTTRFVVPEEHVSAQSCGGFEARVGPTHRRVPQPGRARNRQGASQAGSCQTANDGSDKSGMGVPRSIETRNKTHACMALRWNETKKNTVLRIRMGRDQGRGRCLVALA